MSSRTNLKQTLLRLSESSQAIAWREDIRRAALEWRFETEVPDLPRPSPCEACRTPILHAVHIKNRRNGRVLRIGTECFRILKEFQAGQAAEGRDAREMRARFREQLRSAYSHLPGVLDYERRSWIEWMRVRGAMRNVELSSRVRRGVDALMKDEWIEDQDVLAACVEYYSHNREFDAKLLLGTAYARYGLESTSRITIARADELKRGTATPASPGPAARWPVQHQCCLECRQKMKLVMRRDRIEISGHDLHCSSRFGGRPPSRGIPTALCLCGHYLPKSRFEEHHLECDKREAMLFIAALVRVEAERLVLWEPASWKGVSPYVEPTDQTRWFFELVASMVVRGQLEVIKKK